VAVEMKFVGDGVQQYPLAADADHVGIEVFRRLDLAADSHGFAGTSCSLQVLEDRPFSHDPDRPTTYTQGSSGFRVVLDRHGTLVLQRVRQQTAAHAR
jgi:hypothetical protein